MENTNQPLVPSVHKYPLWQVVLLGAVIVLHLVYLYLVGSGFQKWAGFTAITFGLSAIELVFIVYLAFKKVLLAYLYLVFLVLAVFLSLNVIKTINNQTVVSREIKNPAAAASALKTGIDFQQIVPSYLPVGFKLSINPQWPNDSIEQDFVQDSSLSSIMITEQAINFPKGTVGLTTIDNINYGSSDVQHTTVNETPAYLFKKPSGGLELGFRIGQVNITIYNSDGKVAASELKNIAASMK